MKKKPKNNEVEMMKWLYLSKAVAWDGGTCPICTYALVSKRDRITVTDRTAERIGMWEGSDRKNRVTKRDGSDLKGRTAARRTKGK